MNINVTPALSLYAFLGLFIWQSAMAGPGMLPSHSYSASGARALEIAPDFSPRDPLVTDNASLLRPYVNNPKKCLFGNSLGDREYNEVYPDRGSLAGTKVLTKKSYRFLLFVYNMWITRDPRSSIAQPLSLETAHNWKVFAKLYQKFTESKLGPFENWLRENAVRQGPDFEKSVSDLEWTLRRGGSQQSIWWTREQISKWQKSKYDWKFMITLGDLLQFEQVGKDFELSKTRIKEIQKSLPSLLEAAKLRKSFGSRLEGPEGSKEVQTLRIFVDENDKSMYESRIGQVINKIEQKLKDQWSNAPVSKLPHDLLSDIGLLALLRGAQSKVQPDTYKLTLRHHEIIIFKPHGRGVVSAEIVPEQRNTGQAASVGYARQGIASSSLERQTNWQASAIATHAEQGSATQASRGPTASHASGLARDPIRTQNTGRADT